MNDLESITTIDEQTLIDQIIDGDLSPAQLRVAVTRLDESPDGWKRCALAFIEAQCWQQAMRAPIPAQSPGVVSQRTGQDASIVRYARQQWIRAAAAAAIVAVAVTIGWFGRELAWDESVDKSTGEPFLSLSLDHSRFVPIKGPLGERTVPIPDHGSSTSIVVSDSPATDTRNRSVRTIGQLRLATGAEVTEVPILSGPGLDENWLRNQPPALAREQREFYESQGYEVHLRRRIVTAPLADGRQLNVPIDDVQIRHGAKTSL